MSKRLEKDPDEWMRDMEHSSCTIMDSALQFSGIVRQIIVDDKGVTAIVVFGMPPFLVEKPNLRVRFSSFHCMIGPGGRGRNSPTNTLIYSASSGQPLPFFVKAVEFSHYLSFELESLAIGIGTGPVFCGLIGAHNRRDFSVVGARVNVAARLSGIAEAGEIVLDSPTRMDIEAFDFTPIKNAVLKGINLKEQIYRLKNLNREKYLETLSTSQKMDEKYVGVTEVKKEIRTALRFHQTLVLTGDRGVGKVRF